VSSQARANLKTIHGIAVNINATIKRLDADKKNKEKFAEEFLQFVMKPPEKLREKRGELEIFIKRAIRAVDLTENVKFAKVANEFLNFLDNEPFEANLFKLYRERLLNCFRILYAKDTSIFERILVDTTQAITTFVNKLTHFVDTIRKDAQDYIEREYGTEFEELDEDEE